MPRHLTSLTFARLKRLVNECRHRPKFDEQGSCACFLLGNAHADSMIPSLKGRFPGQSTCDETEVSTKLFLMRMAEDMDQRSFARDPRYDDIATHGHAGYTAADPFPHAIFDGGHLELWDKTMTRCVPRILPVFNRCDRRPKLQSRGESTSIRTPQEPRCRENSDAFLRNASTVVSLSHGPVRETLSRRWTRVPRRS